MTKSLEKVDRIFIFCGRSPLSSPIELSAFDPLGQAGGKAPEPGVLLPKKIPFFLLNKNASFRRSKGLLVSES